MASYLLDIENADKQLTVERLHVGDNGIRTLEFGFVNGAKHIDLPKDCLATLYAVLPDGTRIFDPCTVNNDKVIYTLIGGTGHPSLTSLEGEAVAEIRLTFPDGKVITSPTFSIFCDGIIQDDDAIIANESFSALTDALGRVCLVESGLSSKVDKTEGAEGNMVVFGQDNKITDGGAPSHIYVIPFHYDPTDEQKAEILDIFNKIQNDVCAYSIQMAIENQDGYKIPAQCIVTAGTSNFTAVMRSTLDASYSVQYNIQITASRAVRCWSEDIQGAGEGANGATFTPTVSADGTLFWTNDKGLENPAPVNVIGPQGPAGYTPEKGTDYFTEDDKQELVLMVLDTLPVAEEESF